MAKNLTLKTLTLALILVLASGLSVFAKEKPEITRHDVQYLDRKISVTVQWQSPNPVVFVRISAGQDQRDIKVDEYDNRRNQDGYSGEVSISLNVDPRLYQDSIPYVIQIEDDIRQKSEVLTGKVKVFTPKEKDDDWGKERLTGPAPAGQPGQQGDIIDKLIGVMERHDTPPTVDKINVALMGGGNVTFSTKAIDDKGLRELTFKVFEANATPAGDQTLTGLGKIWQGTSKTFTLASGTYKVVAQAVDTAGNTSPERSETFTITGGAQPQQAGGLIVSITPQNAITAGGQWRVDGGAWKNSGDNATGLAAGQHTVDFKDITGWTRPAAQTLTIQANQTTTASGAYVEIAQLPQVGTLSVTITPAEAVFASAQWNVDGGAWMNSGDNATNLTGGQHTVNFKDITGWTKPASQTVTIQVNQTTTISGAYTKTSGFLSVAILPQAAIDAGGQWRADNGTWMKSGDNVTLSEGTHTVEFKDAASWVKPAVQTVTIKAGQTSSVSGAYGRLYTIDKDFDEGQMVGVEHQTVKDQLQLSKTSTTLPFIWVPNSNEGTISKVDSRTGAELGRYRTGPGTNGSPSRTTVDLKGNCWVGNRATGTAVKVGLDENGQCVDRNGNGKIDTSTGSQPLAWGDDECVLFEVLLSVGKENTYVPGAYKGPYDSAPGPRGVAIDANNNVWLGTYGTHRFYYVDGSSGRIMKTLDVTSANHGSYGAVVDSAGILWSADIGNRNVLKLNPATGAHNVIRLGHMAYGIGLDKNNHLFVAGWTDNKLSRINTSTGQIEWTKAGESGCRGVAVTNDGDVWVANSFSNTVTRFSNNGDKKASIPGMNHPTGVAVDADGKVWVVNNGDNYIKRIDPATNKIDLSKAVGGSHYGYSDMTGIVARSSTTKLGTWTVLFDSKTDAVKWGSVSWNGPEAQGAVIKVRVRSSNDQKTWSVWEDAVKGSDLKATTGGRYLQAEVTLQVMSGEISPVLNDITVKVKQN
ncbi:MAG: hypothetical protein EPN22_05960 [Nitrospirae bacterium]|nr:MAG: hypothetical protein EPN22_05960 [Nitrospirota bacterium]